MPGPPGSDSARPGLLLTVPACRLQDLQPPGLHYWAKGQGQQEEISLEGRAVGPGNFTRHHRTSLSYSHFQCSKTCGKGEKFRLVQCVDVRSKSLSVVKEDLCSATKKPQPNKFCNKQPCPFIWKVGDWSQVSTQYLVSQGHS